MSDNEVTIERLRPSKEPITHLRCGGCGQLRIVKSLDALCVDLAGCDAMRGAAFVLVYFCRRRKTCEHKAREHFQHWLHREGLFVAGETQPPK